MEPINTKEENQKKKQQEGGKKKGGDKSKEQAEATNDKKGGSTKNESKESKTSKTKQKKKADATQEIAESKINDNAGNEKVKLKRKIFALTTYEEMRNEEKEKKNLLIAKKEAKTSETSTLSLGEKIITSKKAITSKTIIKMLLKRGITSLNEEILIILLKISKSGLSKQGMACRELINGIKILIMSIDNEDSYLLTDKDRGIVGHILSIVNELTYSIGGLENTCSYIKKVIQKIPMNRSMIDVKEALLSKLDEFINTKINTKDIISTKQGINLIKENDCLLIYGKSQIFRNILTRAVQRGINFRVIYVDNRQNNYIKTEIEFLSKLGISVVYSYVNGISGIIDKVTKVFIKAKSMLSNGNLLGGVGTSLIACIANNFKKPVIAFSETYKFWDKIMMNSFQTGNMQTEADYTHNFNSMRLLYDITPANYINMIVCEHGYIPPTSVPVVIREFGQEEVEFERI